MLENMPDWQVHMGQEEGLYCQAAKEIDWIAEESP